MPRYLDREKVMKVNKHDHVNHCASLRVIMTAPPLAPKVHADILRRRVAARRKAEEQRDRRALGLD